MLKQIKIFLGIFLCLAASRFIPHPWNFTSLLALSFYVPSFLGLRYVPHLIISFAITDFIIGYHGLVMWTWGSVLLISLLTLKFKGSIKLRVPGAILGAVIFFILTNFGVWTTGLYGYSASGLITFKNSIDLQEILRLPLLPRCRLVLIAVRISCKQQLFN